MVKRALCLVLMGTSAWATPTLADTAHEPTIAAGSHPRLILQGTDEVTAARNKVNNNLGASYWSNAIYTEMLSQTIKRNLSPAGPWFVSSYDAAEASHAALVPKPLEPSVTPTAPAAWPAA